MKENILRIIGSLVIAVEKLWRKVRPLLKKLLAKLVAAAMKITKAATSQKEKEAPVEAQIEQSRPVRRKRKPRITLAQLLPKALMVLFAATFCFSAIQLIRNTRQADKRDELYKDLANVAVKPADDKTDTDDETSMGGNETAGETTETTEGPAINITPGLHIPEEAPLSVDFEFLQEKYPDVMAWVYCPGTPISYPVVRGEDNDYYLNRLPDGTTNKSGSIFADCRNMVDFSDPHTIIYGHNMKDMSMFGAVNDYAKQAYYEQHPVWYINTPEKNYAVVILAGYVAAPNAEIYAFKGTPDEPKQILQTALKHSVFQTKATYEEGEHLVTFSTCRGNSRRFVLVGALREIG